MSQSDWIPQVVNRRGKRRHKNRYTLSNDGGVSIDAAVNENLAHFSSAEQALAEYVLGAAFPGHWGRQGHRVVHGSWRITDFVCNQAALAVEADDDSHWEPDRIVDDFARDVAFADDGFRTLRFSDEELLYHTPQVIEQITKTCAERLARRRRVVPETLLNTQQLVDRASDLGSEDMERLYDLARERFGLRSVNDARFRAFINNILALTEARRSDNRKRRVP